HLAAPSVPYVLGTGNPGRDVDDGGHHLAPERGGEALRVVDTVLQAEDEGVALEVRRECRAGALRIGRFDGEKHELRAARAPRLLARTHGNARVEGLRLHT